MEQLSNKVLIRGWDASSVDRTYQNISPSHIAVTTRYIYAGVWALFEFVESLKSIQLQPILALAGIVLSAAYSEENDATINIPDPKRPLLDTDSIRLHFGAEQPIKNLQSEVLRRLHEGVREGNTETLMATHKELGKRSNLPKILVASQMDGGVQALFLRSEYVLAITCRASISDVRSCPLRGHYDSSRFDERDCQNLLDRIRNSRLSSALAKTRKLGIPT